MPLLLIKKDFTMDDGSPSGLTGGKVYLIRSMGKERVRIDDDDGYPHAFTIDGSCEFCNEHVEVIGRNVDDSD